MKSFYDFIREDRGFEIPEENIPGEWFAKHRLPMVVACCCCGMTMALPSAWIDDDGSTFCSDCAHYIRYY